MNRTTALCAAGLMLLAVVPLGTAHLTNPNGSDTSAIHSDDDFCRRGDNGPDTVRRCLDLDGDGTEEGGADSALHSQVSGSYVLPGTLIHVISDLLPLYSPNLILFPLGFAEVFNPLAVCDVEVGGGGGGDDGGLSDEILSESTVDSQTGVGLIPDGTWDDGGIGCASHTNHYIGDHSLADLIDPTNTPTGACPGPTQNPPGPGCWVLNTYGCGGTAYAEDKVSGDDVWIETSCADIDISTFDVLGCIINDGIFALNPTFIVTDCIPTAIGEATGTPVGATIACGNGASSNPSNFGEGGGNNGIGVLIPTADATGLPGSVGGTCDWNANEAVIVHNAVDLREIEDSIAPIAAAPWINVGPGSPPNDSLLQSVIRALHVPATIGWIDSSTATTGGSDNPGGAGTAPPLCADTKARNGFTHAPDLTFSRNYSCAPVPVCVAGAVAVYVSGPIFRPTPPNPANTPNPTPGSGTGTASCTAGTPVTAAAGYAAPPYDGANAAAAATLAGTGPTCTAAFGVGGPPGVGPGAPPAGSNSADFVYAQCVIV